MDKLLGHIERLVALLVSVVSFFVYLSTMAPTASLWDCGEFILCSRFLEVGHPPGAPLYVMAARLFSMFASDSSQVAWWCNLLSVVSSAVAVGLLSLVIVYLMRMSGCTNRYLSVASAAIASLAFAVSDTFWFSAVESEVYAFSMLFTMATLWSLFKWREFYCCGLPSSTRWLWLSVYMVGLSSGVHLLSLLVVPIIVVVVWHELRGGFVVPLLVGSASLAFLLFGVVSNGLQPAMILEMLLSVGGGLPMHCGLALFGILLFVALFVGVFLSRRRALLHVVFVSLLLFSIGYLSNVYIIVRASAGTDVNLNKPDNVFSLNSMINREQYGSRPFVWGPWYGSVPASAKTETRFRPDTLGGYESYSKFVDLDYDDDQEVFFPRMYVRDSYFKDAYLMWAGKNGDGAPSFWDEVVYMMRYQIDFMYVRYLMWNFAGRQNDNRGHGDALSGNWISGIDFVDSYLGQRHKLHPDEERSGARTTYYMLPFIFGLLGMVCLLARRRSMYTFAVLTLLFLLMGPAIAFYLNQAPFEPRERDYAYVGSFAMFAVYIALGVRALLSLAYRFTRSSFVTSLLGLLLSLAVPGLMFSQNLYSHDRSGRTFDVDMAKTYLQLCEKDAILFTEGDNDTYPLWYVQNVEGFRRDVHVVNVGLLGADWYVEQVASKRPGCERLKMTVPPYLYREGVIYDTYSAGQSNDSISSQSFLSQIANGRDYAYQLPSGDKMNVFDSGFCRIQRGRDDELVVNVGGIMYCAEVAFVDLVSSNPELPVYVVSGSSVVGRYDLYSQMCDLGPVAKLTNRKFDVRDRIAHVMDNLVLPSAEQYHVNNDVVTCFCNMWFRPFMNELAEDALSLGDKELTRSVLLKSQEVFPLYSSPMSDGGVELALLLSKAGAKEESRAAFSDLVDYYLSTIEYWMAVSVDEEVKAQSGLNRDALFGQNLLDALSESGYDDLYAAIVNYYETYGLYSE